MKKRKVNVFTKLPVLKVENGRLWLRSTHIGKDKKSFFIAWQEVVIQSHYGYNCVEVNLSTVMPDDMTVFPPIYVIKEGSNE